MANDKTIHRHYIEDKRSKKQGVLERQLKNGNPYNLKKLDSNMCAEGSLWFDSGLPLEEAPIDKKNNFSFVAGFNRAKRISEINDKLYNIGVDWFYSGKSLEELSDEYKNNEYVILGYNNASLKNNR